MMNWIPLLLTNTATPQGQCAAVCESYQPAKEDGNCQDVCMYVCMYVCTESTVHTHSGVESGMDE
jgi:hypothetical protein